MLYKCITQPNSNYAVSTSATRLNSQTVTFRDGDSGWDVSMGDSFDSTRDVTYHSDVELQEFFARPIQINQYKWTPGTAFSNPNTVPWRVFLQNKRVANRISNYKNFSGKLCLKFMINGNSFYYGRIMAYYMPLANSDVGAGISSSTMPAKIMNSQRMKVFIDPAESSAGTMCLPFMWFYDKLDLTQSNIASDLGQLSMVELNALKHANGASTPLTITVYAWMQDVKLSMPTTTNVTTISAQAGSLDEYKSKTLSGVASAVAKTAGKLSTLPVIGPYAKSTSMAAGAMSSVARMFGLSRPVMVDPPMLVQPRYVSGFATTDVPDSSVKLTVDSKQELTIDSRITGADDGDELVLAKIASKESYIGTFTWPIGSVLNGVLFSCRVMPQHYYRDTVSTYTSVPACGFVAAAFKYWKGTMRYRFQIVSSGYHKGRLLFVWDPHAASTVPETNVQYTKIVDLQQDKDFTLDIAWGQPRAWGVCTDFVDNGLKFGTGIYSTPDSNCNGVLTVYVLNELTSPNSTINNDIQINVYCSMCEDAQFAVPHNRIASYVPFGGTGATPQAGDLDGDPIDNVPVVKESTEEYFDCLPVGDSSDLVYMGETVASFRQLMKRYNLMWNVGIVAGTQGYFTWNASDFPLVRGYDPDGLRAGATMSYNPVNTTMMRYLAMAFVNYRGGVRYRLVPGAVSTGSNNALFVARRNLDRINTVPTVTAQTTTTTAAYEDQGLSFSTNGMEGMHLTIPNQQPVLDVEFPFYSNARFVATRRGYLNKTGDYPVVENLTHNFTTQGMPNQATLYNIYVAAAEDSNFSCFQGCLPFMVSATFS